MAELPEVLETVVLGPEDRLVLNFGKALDRWEAEHIGAMIRDAGLDGRVLFTDGTVTAHVLRATKAGGSTVGQCGDQIPPLLGAPSTQSCHLAHGHSGMHSDGQATWSNDPPIELLPKPSPMICGHRREYPSGEFSVCSLRPGHEGNHVGDDDTWSNEGSQS